MAVAVTTIQVTVEVRDELRLRGRKGDSYDDIIRRLLVAARAREVAPPELLRPPFAATTQTLFPRRELP